MRTIVAVMSFALLAACATDGPRIGYYVTPTEMLEVYGTYALSNGDTLTISREHKRYWAEMKRTGRAEIVPVASLVFVEKSGVLRYTFTPLPFTTDVRIDASEPPTALAAVLGTRSGIERELGK